MGIEKEREREREKRKKRKKKLCFFTKKKISGGLGMSSSTFECYSFENCKWNNTLYSVNEKRRFATLTSASSTSFVIGGETSSTNLVSSFIELDEHMVPKITEMKNPISRHCAVKINDKIIFLIAGHIGKTQFSDQTLSFDTTLKNFAFNTAKLNKGRQLHSCAMFDANTIIVAGGRDLRGGLKSVETLDIRSSKRWSERKNLELEQAISYAELVTSPYGNFEFYFIFEYSQTCVQRPPIGPEKRGRYAEAYMKKISGK